MKPSLDRTVKLIWLAIGALLLLLLAAGGVMMLAQAVGNAGASREAARVVSDTAARVREAHPVRYGMPDSIPGTTTRIVMVGDGGTAYDSRRESYESTGQRSGRDVNVMFVDASGVRLLLDRPAFIRDVSYPRAGPGEAPHAWISYVV